MITLITGLPGNGKTLFALWLIKQKAEKENRPVFYHNIKDLNLPWTLIEPEKWMECPPGSIIVLDEAQFVFSKKPNGANLPEHYSKLAVHRHSGFDIFVITQHPSLLDNFVRQLVGQHYHSIRKFGLARSTIYEWSSANTSPQSASSHKNAISLKWAYPKEVYGYYKSAEVHTVKRTIPAKLILGILFICAVAFGSWYAWESYKAKHSGKASQVSAVVPGENGVAPGVGGSVPPGVGDARPFDPIADAKQYVAMNTPRVVGLPHTAPKYDELTKPTRVPVPAACIQMGSTSSGKPVRCQCYTQQATKMDVEYNSCIHMAQNGWFRDFNENGASPPPVVPVPAPPPVQVEQQSLGSAVSMFAESPPLPRPEPPPKPEQDNTEYGPRPGGAFRSGPVDRQASL